MGLKKWSWKLKKKLGKKEMEERFNVTDELDVPLKKKTRFIIYEVNLSEWKSYFYDRVTFTSHILHGRVL